MIQARLSKFGPTFAQDNFRSRVSAFSVPFQRFPSTGVCMERHLILNQAEANLAEVTGLRKQAACRREHQINLHQLYDALARVCHLARP